MKQTYTYAWTSEPYRVRALQSLQKGPMPGCPPRSTCPAHCANMQGLIDGRNFAKGPNTPHMPHKVSLEWSHDSRNKAAGNSAACAALGGIAVATRCPTPILPHTARHTRSSTIHGRNTQKALQGIPVFQLRMPAT